ncbi:MAG: mechanosensitive ion channel [Lachnospiraceae bacterium]|nr:mechanosensitive ion channel [Lachnospiraceae bacterium]
MLKEFIALKHGNIFPESIADMVVPEETIPPLEEATVSGVTSWLEGVLDWLLMFGQDVVLPLLIKIVIAFFIFIIGKKLVKQLIKFMDKSLHKANVEEGTIHFLTSLASGLGVVILVFVVAGYLNFSTGPIVAILGSAGLAIGLALQGSLANFAGGVLILIMKPFRIGDYICALGTEGTVTKIDMVYTTLSTGDNQSVVIPNGTLSNANIVNVTKEEKRRVDLVVGIDYDEDIRKVRTILEGIIEKQELILKEEGSNVFVNNFDASSISMGIRVWTKTEDYWTVKWALQEKIKIVFDENNISIPFERLDVNILNPKE